MLKTEGFKSIYAGLSAALVRQAVYITSRIGFHRSISNELQARNHGKPISFAMKTFAGMVSGSLAVCIGTPFDVAVVRMQADSMKPLEARRRYKGVFNALFRVVKEEGVMKLYSGLVPNVMRGMAVNVGMLSCFDQAKEFISLNVMHEPLGTSPSVATQIMASLVGSFSASALSLPFDLLKSRLQNDSRYKGFLDAAQKVLIKEGPLAFWTGFSAYYMRTAPMLMIILMSQESISQLYKKLFL